MIHNKELHISAETDCNLDTLFALLRSAIWGEERFPFHAPADTDWMALYRELEAQTVQFLPLDLLIREDPKHTEAYMIHAANAIQNWYSLMEIQQEICTLLENKKLPFVILKGSAAACYYPQPEYRCMGDIDLLVLPSDYDTVTELFREHQFSESEDTNPYHRGFYYKNAHIELHQKFARLTTKEQTKWLDEKFYHAIAHCSNHQMESYHFPMLPSTENGLVLLQHIKQHLEGGLGLRQVIDWMLYVEKELDDEVWNDSFCSLVEQTGLKTLAVTVTRLCQIYLGLQTDLTWCKDADPELCHDLMNYIVTQGNFGRKIGSNNNTAIRVLGMRNIFSLIKHLQQRGLANWKLIKKYPMLKPFAWCYQVVRYIRLGLKRKHPVKSGISDINSGIVRNHLLNRLMNK